MKRNVCISAAAAVVLMAGGPVAAATAAAADTARTVPAAAVARVDVTAEGAADAAVKHYPGVVESLDRDGSVWHVDVVSKDGKSHAELELNAEGAVTQEDKDANEDADEHKALLAAKVTAGQAAKAALAAHPGQVWQVEWDDGDDGGQAPYWHVEVRAADGKTSDAAVDATTAKVTSPPSDSDGDDDQDGNY
ncbi:PepSY domain-containing protein [Streptomyces xanthophaeus]|uniref:PepSY domain-containing protein n=1 Tax=Streptomyces xanthophaeus TaxID=67385 RepID=UPI0039901B81